MSEKVKKVRVKQKDGTMSDYIPIGADASNIDMQNGLDAETIIGKKPYYFSSVAAMKAAEYLKEGDCVITLGYYKPNDGGAGDYTIVSGEYTDDGGSIHALSNGLYAELIIKNGEVNVKQFGAYGDGEHDDGEKLKKAFSIGGTIFFPKNESFLTSVPIVTVENTIIKGNNSEIKLLDNTFKNVLFGSSHLTINDLIITGTLNNKDETETLENFKELWNNRKNEQLLSLFNVQHVVLQNCTFQQNISEGIKVSDSEDIAIKNCHFFKLDCGFISQGSNLKKCTIENCDFNGHIYSESISLYCTNGNIEDIFILNNKINNKPNASGILIGHENINKTSISNNIVIANNIIKNTSGGISMYAAHNVNIENNIIINSSIGMTLFNCKIVNINNNIMKNLSKNAITLLDNADSINIIDNQIYEFGIVNDLGGAIQVGKKGEQESIITNCSFINNTIHTSKVLNQYKIRFSMYVY